MEVMAQVLDVHPRVSEFQVLNDNGDYLVSAYRKKWLPPTPRGDAGASWLWLWP